LLVKRLPQRLYGDHGQRNIPPENDIAQISPGKGTVIISTAIFTGLQPYREIMGKHETLSP